MDFKVGDKVTRKSGTLVDVDCRPDYVWGMTGYILHIIEAHNFQGYVIPKLYVVKFDAPEGPMYIGVERDDIVLVNENSTFIETSVEREKRGRRPVRKFRDGDKIICNNKFGKIRRLRDDEYERTQVTENHYYIDYDDGTFDTYQSESYISSCQLGNYF